MNASPARGQEIRTDFGNDPLGTLLLLSAITYLALELPPRSACSQNTACCAESVHPGLGSCQKTGWGFRMAGMRDYLGPCRTSPLPGIWVILMVLSFFSMPSLRFPVSLSQCFSHPGSKSAPPVRAVKNADAWLHSNPALS